MLFIHSYWTAPRPENYIYDADLWYAALSISYIHRLGHTIDLYTDSLGYEIFSVLPYDNIHVVLDDLHKTINPHIWSASKFKALEIAPLGACHIDYDFFLKDFTFDDIEHYDMFCQSLIPDNADYRYVSRYIRKACIKDPVSLPQNIHFDFKEHILHLGIWQLTNQELKDEIIGTYFYMAEELSKKMPEKAWDCPSHFVPNLFLEEQLVGEIAYNPKYHVHCLINVYDEQGFLNIQHQNPYIEHFAGSQKYFRLDYVILSLKEVNVEVYEMLKAHSITTGFLLDDYFNELNKIE